MIDLDGQVAIVTGAGRGIGRETALALSARGARVVVNDYGGGPDAITKGSSEVALSVVEEIQSRGGAAAASNHSVGSGEAADAIVTCAIEAFGKIDILVNTAGGSLGIVALDQDTDAEVEGVLRSNLIGPYMLCRRVWPHMKSQCYGRIVNILSGAMLGMPCTAAYSAAKSGLIGLTRTAALEGAELGIKVNGVLPVAQTRLAGKLEDEAMIAWMKQFPARLAAEGVVAFCDPNLSITGEMFSIGGGRAARLAFYGATGMRDDEFNAERLAARIDEALDMSGAELIRDTLHESNRFAEVASVPQR